MPVPQSKHGPQHPSERGRAREPRGKRMALRSREGRWQNKAGTPILPPALDSLGKPCKKPTLVRKQAPTSGAKWVTSSVETEQESASMHSHPRGPQPTTTALSSPSVSTSMFLIAYQMDSYWIIKSSKPFPAPSRYSDELLSDDVSPRIMLSGLLIAPSVSALKSIKKSSSPLRWTRELFYRAENPQPSRQGR